MLKFSNLKNVTIKNVQFAVKRVVITSFALCTVFFVNAQEAGIGANIILDAGKNDTEVGYGLKFFGGAQSIRGAIEFDFFPTKYNTAYDFSLYGNYHFSLFKKFTIYPSIGIGVVGPKADIKSAWSPPNYFALSLGGGIEYSLIPELILNCEVRCKLLGGNYLGGYNTNISFGLAYRFLQL